MSYLDPSLQATAFFEIFQPCFDFCRMYDLVEKHQKFLHYILHSAKYDKEYFATAIPTCNFYIGAVLLSYLWCHNRTRHYTRWRLWAARELTFQWLLFYTFRLWIFAIHGLKILMVKGKAYVLKEPEDYDDKSTIMFTMSMIICIALSFAPYIIVAISTLMADTGQNFFVWLGDDPWLRSEIGLAGHYLMRPANIAGQPKHRCAYRIRRSCSLNDLVHSTAEAERSNDNESYLYNSLKNWHSDNDLTAKFRATIAV